MASLTAEQVALKRRIHEHLMDPKNPLAVEHRRLCRVMPCEDASLLAYIDFLEGQLLENAPDFNRCDNCGLVHDVYKILGQGEYSLCPEESPAPPRPVPSNIFCGSLNQEEEQEEPCTATTTHLTPQLSQ